ncbi:cyclic nucleotide-binding domain-containing protein [Pedobacter frigidisoli]|uniref:Cyclic nucleotide-binding domain-containing protein n=1 Tax=Pedobacter frigidisoli TaxID=2530455 RepID=A0A4R0NAY2_9SPHI|nr:cyclic nucleotide-binding domain-containing protein [Pedobacter frigidisoli]
MLKQPIPEADLLETLGLIVPLPAPFQQRVNEEVITEKFGRKHLLLRPGEIARRLYFIRSGFLRAFFIDENGKECTTWFMGNGDLMISELIGIGHLVQCYLKWCRGNKTRHLFRGQINWNHHIFLGQLANLSGNHTQ